MMLKVISVIISVILLNANVVSLADTEVKDSLHESAENGLGLVLNAINILLYGEPKENSYKDMFIVFCGKN